LVPVFSSDEERLLSADPEDEEGVLYADWPVVEYCPWAGTVWYPNEFLSPAEIGLGNSEYVWD
jgi:hypothetical protein